MKRAAQSALMVLCALAGAMFGFVWLLFVALYSIDAGEIDSPPVGTPSGLIVAPIFVAVALVVLTLRWRHRALALSAALGMVVAVVALVSTFGLDGCNGRCGGDPSQGTVRF